MYKDIREMVEIETPEVACRRCGAKIEVQPGVQMQELTCPRCGHKMLLSGTGPISSQAFGVAPKPKKKKNRWLIFLAAMIALVALLNAGRQGDAPSLSGGTYVTSGASSDGQGYSWPNYGSTSRDPAQTSDSTAQTSDSTAQTSDSTAQTSDSTAQTSDSTAQTSDSTAQTPARERAQQIIPYFHLRYFLNSLRDDELHVICDLYEGAINFEEAVEFTVPISELRFPDLFQILGEECPELFQIDYRASSPVLFGEGRTYTKFWYPYRFTEDEYRRMRGACDAVIEGFRRATVGKTDYEKEKYVFDYMASRDHYDLNAPYAGTAYGALVDGVAKCDGFSYAFKWAMESLGVQCLYVAGNPTSENEVMGHAWNIINLGGQYYRVDLTASTLEEGAETYGFTAIHYFALNVPDRMAEDTDKRYKLYSVYERLAPVPVCNRVDMSYYFLNGGFISADSDYYVTLTDWVSGLGPNGGAFYAQFESYAAYNKFISGEYDKLLCEVLDKQSRRYRYQTVWYANNGIGIRVWYE